MGMLGQVLGGVAASRLGGRGRGGSPVVKALMLVLAAKAAQQVIQRRRTEGAAAGAGSPRGGGFGGGGLGAGPRAGEGQAAPGGGVGGGLGGGLGGLLAGVAGGGGLGALIEQFRRTGHGDAVDSWVRPGPNQRLAPQQLAQALGPETVDAMQEETGMDRDQLLDDLSDTLPEAVDQLTPDGRLPDPDTLRDD